MIAATGATLHIVEREPEMLPFVVPLLRRWMQLEFDPSNCRKALEDVIRDPRSGADESILDPAAVSDGGVVATDALLYPKAQRALRFRIFDDDGPPRQATAPFDETAADEVGSLLRWLTGASERSHDLSWLPDHILADLVRPSHEASIGFPRIDEPGIYRREHGCVVIRSTTTTLMLDPVAFWMPQASRTPLAIEGELDAIFITHGHADHFSIPSILANAKPTHTVVVVPPVPRASLLAPHDMLGSVRLFGLDAIAPPWGSTLSVGDIRVDVLPFFGEQPVRDGEGPADGLRNWGSCYRFTTPQFTAVSLIDSGVDPFGDMAEVVADGRDQWGPTDFFLSSLPRFHSPFFFGLPHYYLALPFDRSRQLFAQYQRGALPSVTPGPDGIVDVCRAGTPRYYLPYGNGYEGLGAPISDVGMHIGEPSERDTLRYLADRLENEGIPTTPIGWNPGDRVSLQDGRAERIVYEPSLGGSRRADLRQ
jgi:Beta-lactamase superfamily domain